MLKRHRFSLRLIAVITAVAVVSVFTVSAMAAVSGTLHPLPRTVLLDATAQPTDPAIAANPGTDPTPGPSNAGETSTAPETPAQQPTDSPIVTLAPPSNWAGGTWVPPTPPPTPSPPPTPTLAPTEVPPSRGPGGFIPGYQDPGGGQTQEAHGLRAVLVVGPSGEVKTNIGRADEFAAKAEKYGMQVTKIYAPCATWELVRNAAQGANLLAYWGHGNGFPSPYSSTLGDESTKDGFGLNLRCNDSWTQQHYYGAKFIREQIQFAPNSVVVLSHLCYSAGNAEPGLPLPTLGVAIQRVDNHANGFLKAGAKAVFAYGTGDAAMILDGLFKGTKTMDDIFMTPGREPRPYYGWTGYNPWKGPSERVPDAGIELHLDPGVTEGFLRALTGHLDYSTAEWRGGN